MNSDSDPEPQTGSHDTGETQAATPTDGSQRPFEPVRVSLDTSGDFSDPTSGLRPPRPQPPRLWTVFVALLVAFVLSIGLSALAALVFILPLFLEDPQSPPTAEEITEAVLTPVAMLAQAVPAQLAILGTALIAAFLSPVPWRERIGLVDSGLSFVQWLVVGISCFAVAAFGLLLAQGLSLILEPDPTAAVLFENMTAGLAIPWILFIALAPGFGEEILFRGYVQRRLLQRWTPARAILVSSFVFAAFHIMPHTVLFAFPIGIWLGYIAWKTGSIWPTILGHALVNGIWNILNISSSMYDYDERYYWIACGVLVAMGVIAWFWSLKILATRSASDAIQLESRQLAELD